jgi:hypothetical protein
MTKKPCTHEHLASNATGKVLICRECGVVHLHLQNLSLCFEVEQFTEFAAMMPAAANRIDSESGKSSSKRPKLTLVH